MAAGGSGNTAQETPWNYSSLTVAMPPCWSTSASVVALNATTSCVDQSAIPNFIPSILCLTIAPLCFIVFGITLVVLMCRHHESMRQFIAECYEKMKPVTGSGDHLPPEADVSLLQDDLHYLSTSPQVGSTVSRTSTPSRLCHSYEYTERVPHYNTPEDPSALYDSEHTFWNAFCSHDRNRSGISTEAPSYPATTDLSASTGHSDPSVQLEWDYFMPDGTRATQGASSTPRPYPTLKDTEYWV